MRKSYKVMFPLRHDQVDYAVGEEVTLDAKQAAPLLDLGAVVDLDVVDSTASADAIAEQTDKQPDADAIPEPASEQNTLTVTPSTEGAEGVADAAAPSTPKPKGKAKK